MEKVDLGMILMLNPDMPIIFKASDYYGGRVQAYSRGKIHENKATNWKDEIKIHRENHC